MLSESQLRMVVNEMAKYELYHDTFSGAVQHARQEVENRGFVIDEDDWWSEITVGPGRPKEGKTTRANIGLFKDGKKQRKMLQIQVYNRGNNVKNNYELNFYIM